MSLPTLAQRTPSQAAVTNDNLSLLSIAGSLVDHVYLNGARGIAVVDNYAYIPAYDNDRFTVLNVTEDDPVFVSSIKLPGGNVDGAARLLGPRAVDAQGDIVALVESLSDTLRLISVKNKLHPAVLGSITHSSINGAVRVQFDGRWVYVSGSDGWAIFDCAVPTAPAFKGALSLPGADIFGFAVEGDTAYLAGSATNRYYAVDITDKANPTLISYVELPLSGPHAIIISGHLAYTTNSGTDSIDILDVTDPANMVPIGQAADSTVLNGAHTSALLGKFLLVCAQSNSGFAVVDVTDPTDPFVVPNANAVDNTILDGVRAEAVVGRRAWGAAFTSDAVVCFDLHGLAASSASIGSLRSDRAAFAEASVKRLKVHDGITVGPGGLDLLGPMNAPAVTIAGLDAATKAYVDVAVAAVSGGTTASDEVLDAVVLGKAWSNTTFSTFTQLSTRYLGGSRKGSGGQNDEVVFRLRAPLHGGTWTIELLHTATTDRGIYTITTSIDGASYSGLTTVDGYNASLTQTRSEVTGLTIPDGTKFIKLKMLTKNGSSSNYNSEISALYGLRTGA